MNQSGYDFIPLAQTDAKGATYTIGHAIIWNPQKIRMEFNISHEGMARDNFVKTLAPYYKIIEPWKEIEPHPGISVREAMGKYPGGIAYFNAGESGIQINPLIENGRLLTKPAQSRALLQKEWSPLNGTFIFFLQHLDKRVEIRDLRVTQSQIHPDDLKYVQVGTNGFSVPYILRQRERVLLKNPPPGQTAGSGETLYTLGAPAALSAIGLTGDGCVVWLGLAGDVENPSNWKRLATESDLVGYLLDFKVVDALFAGASGDVQYYDANSKTLCVARERPKSEDRRWVLKPGQTERGLSLIIKLVQQEG